MAGSKAYLLLPIKKDQLPVASPWKNLFAQRSEIHSDCALLLSDLPADLQPVAGGETVYRRLQSLDIILFL